MAKYRVVQRTSAMNAKELEKMDDEGWRLVAVTRANIEFYDNGREYYFIQKEPEVKGEQNVST